MGKSLIKQLLKVNSVLWDNLPTEELESFNPDAAQAIIDSPQISGREFMRFLKNRARVHVVGNHVIDCSADPFVPKGWKVEEHRRTGNLVWDPNTVSLFLSNHQKNGKIIEGNTLRKELKGKPVLNACVLDYLLEHQELIPEEWKEKYIFFWGTIYRDSGGLLVRCLCWSGGRWHWFCLWLGYDWFVSHPAAVSAGV